MRAIILALALASPCPAAEWTYDLVVLVHTTEHGKHSATLAGPDRTGPADIEATTCAALMHALAEAGLTAACVPSGMGEAVHSEN